jgi:long-chain acyl-CoA synthetase
MFWHHHCFNTYRKPDQEETMTRTILITGATGFVGRNIIPRIMRSDPESRLILLIRGETDEAVEQRYNDLLQDLSVDLNFNDLNKRIQWVRGDISERRLGLSDQAYIKITNAVTHIIHAAADVRFNQTLSQARKVNLGGTKNIIELANRLNNSGQLEHLVYIGTAYISGTRKGVIYENDLDCGQRFANTYEQSKFETECYVHRWLNVLPITIFRPSIIVGDSKTGVTSAFNVLYKPLRLICHGLINFLPVSRKTRVDIVPIDFVCDSICHILFNRHDSIGKIYHLTAGTRAYSTVGDIVKLSVKYFNSLYKNKRLKRIIFFPAFIHKHARKYYPDRYKKICSALSKYEPYMMISRIFDNTNTIEALRDSDITVPAFGDYYNQLLDYCIETKWGKTLKYAHS